MLSLAEGNWKKPISGWETFSSLKTVCCILCVQRGVRKVSTPHSHTIGSQLYAADPALDTCDGGSSLASVSHLSLPQEGNSWHFWPPLVVYMPFPPSLWQNTDILPRQEPLRDPPWLKLPHRRSGKVAMLSTNVQPRRMYCISRRLAVFFNGILLVIFSPPQRIIWEWLWVKDVFHKPCTWRRFASLAYLTKSRCCKSVFPQLVPKWAVALLPSLKLYSVNFFHR